ncbi:MAG: hypothetical protein K5873_08100 [Treponema sp.]|nr:hypothetical protein [Treponema sp.]
MKKEKTAVIFFAMALFVFIGTIFISCENAGENEASQSQPEQGVETEIRQVSLKTIAVGEYSEAEKKAITEIFPNSDFTTNLSAVDDSYKVVINDYEDLPDNIADDAYYVLHEIQKGEFENVMEDRNDDFWEGSWTEDTEKMVKESLNLCPYASIGYNPSTNSSLYSSTISTKEEWLAVTNNYNEHIKNLGEEFQDTNAVAENLLEESDTNSETAATGRSEEEYYIMCFNNVAYWILSCEESKSEESRAVYLAAAEENQGNTVNELKLNFADGFSYCFIQMFDACVKVPREKTNDLISVRNNLVTEWQTSDVNYFNQAFFTTDSTSTSAKSCAKSTVKIQNLPQWTKNGFTRALARGSI